MANRYVLFQAYGNEAILQECKYALLHLHQWSKDAAFCLVIYTDNESYFTDTLKLFTEYKVVTITPTLIQQWKSEINFVHRVKIEMLLDFFKSAAGAVLYFDTDTYCKRSPAVLFDRIESGKIVMHTYEGKLSNRRNLVFKKWHRFLAKNQIVFNDKVIAEPGSLQMWNAGVVGLTNMAVPHLQQALQLTDLLYRKMPSHVTEQFALGYIFQTNYSIVPADEYVYHYWDLKEFRELLAYYFNKAGVRNLQLQSFFTTSLPEKIFSEKEQYRRAPFYKKLLMRKWSIKLYLQQQ